MSLLSDQWDKSPTFKGWTPKSLLGGERGTLWKLGGRDIEKGFADFDKEWGGGKWMEKDYGGSGGTRNPLRDLKETWEGGGWLKQLGEDQWGPGLYGGRWQDRLGINLFPDDDDGSEDEESSALETITTPTVQETLDLDTGLGEGSEDAPMFTDVSMVASRSKARRNLGALGYDTGTSEGRSIEERKNRRMGTALTSFTATA